MAVAISRAAMGNLTTANQPLKQVKSPYRFDLARRQDQRLLELLEAAVDLKGVGHIAVRNSWLTLTSVVPQST